MKLFYQIQVPSILTIMNTQKSFSLYTLVSRMWKILSKRHVYMEGFVETFKR